MQFRFVEPVEKDDGDYENKLLGYVDIDDYDIAFKTFTFMKEHECEYCVEINSSDLVDEDGELYNVEDVAFISRCIGGELMPHFRVYLKKEC